jgi:hypothetical protein
MAEAKQGYVDRPEVAETFADHCERVIFDGQTLRVDLSVTRYGEPTSDKRATAHRATTCRLVMTPDVAQRPTDMANFALAKRPSCSQLLVLKCRCEVTQFVGP